MATPLARRPAFLAEVPDVPAPEPVRFAPVGGRPAAGARPARAAAQQSAPAAPPSEEVLELRRAMAERVTAAVQTLRAHSQRLAEQARADAIELGFMVARKILETELRQGPEALFALVRTAVRKAGASRRVAVHLHPEDAAMVQAQLDGGQDPELATARVELVLDPTLGRGDCLVDTDFGQIDGRLATRLAEVRRAVEDATGEEGA